TPVRGNDEARHVQKQRRESDAVEVDDRVVARGPSHYFIPSSIKLPLSDLGRPTILGQTRVIPHTRHVASRGAASEEAFNPPHRLRKRHRRRHGRSERYPGRQVSVAAYSRGARHTSPSPGVDQ